MKKIKVYSASELQKEFPDGFTHAHNKWVDSVSNGGGLFWQDEIMDSLKAMFNHSGITLNDWSISDSSPSYVKFSDFDFGETFGDGGVIVKGDYTGKQALQWVEDNLLSQFRYDKNTVWESEYIKNPKRKDGSFHHKKGTLKECPFTGVCYDMDFIDSLLNDVKSGCTLSKAYHNLADCAGKLFYAEYVDQISEEYFIDHADNNNYQYTEDGIQV